MTGSALPLHGFEARGGRLPGISDQHQPRGGKLQPGRFILRPSGLARHLLAFFCSCSVIVVRLAHGVRQLSFATKLGETAKRPQIGTFPRVKIRVSVRDSAVLNPAELAVALRECRRPLAFTRRGALTQKPDGRQLRRLRSRREGAIRLRRRAARSIGGDSCRSLILAACSVTAAQRV